MNSEMMVQYVRACIREQRFVVTDHARTGHTLREGFTVRQGIEALLNGQVIEEYTQRMDDVDRLLFCGTASGVYPEPRFFTTDIHVVVEIEAAAQIVVVTMYRPSVAQWRSPWKRK